MSNLEKLLEGVEVEWKTLGEVASINRGRRVTKQELSLSDKYPVYSGGVTPMGYYKEYNQNENTITVVKYGTAGFVNFITEKFWANDVCYCVKPHPILINKYLFYVLKNNQNYINSLATDAIPAHLPTDAINGITIPIPPLEIQEEIVRILDKFSTLTAELQAELQARKSQYEYYRNQLLDYPMEESDQPSLRSSGSAPSIKESDKQIQQQSAQNAHADNSVLPPQGKVQWKTLGEVVQIKNGKDYKHLKDGDIPVYGSGGIMTYVNAFAFDKPSVLIPRKGSLKNIFYVDMPFWNVDTIFYTDINTKIICPKYLYYYLTTLRLEELNMAGGVPSLTQTILNKLSISIPPLEEQKRIVSILDKFDTLTTSITDGLPKMIEQSQKRYEYYRDMLLSFPSLRTEGEAIQKKHATR